jgi:hypothetical protein
MRCRAGVDSGCFCSLCEHGWIGVLCSVKLFPNLDSALINKGLKRRAHLRQGGRKSEHFFSIFRDLPDTHAVLHHALRTCAAHHCQQRPAHHVKTIDTRGAPPSRAPQARVSRSSCDCCGALRLKPRHDRHLLVPAHKARGVPARPPGQSQGKGGPLTGGFSKLPHLTVSKLPGR